MSVLNIVLLWSKINIFYILGLFNYEYESVCCVCLAHQYTYPVHIVDEIKACYMVYTIAGVYESCSEMS
jgi:hypothetical protein